MSLLVASNDQRIDVEETQHYLLIVWGCAPLLGKPIASCCRTATTSLLMMSARYLTDETLCDSEEGPRRPPGELGLYARGPPALRAPGMGPSET